MQRIIEKAAVCFEVKRERDEAENLFLFIPTTPLKSEVRERSVVLEPSPTFVEDVKAILQKQGEAVK